MDSKGRTSSLSDLDLLRTRSLTSVLQWEIERMILDGELEPGDRLNENALANRFGISRGPVREACRALAEKGLVHLIPNRGVFIREISPQEAAEVYQVRAALFAEAGRLFAATIDDDQLALMQDYVDRMDEAARDRDLDTYYPLNLKFHKTIIDGANNRALKRIYQGLVKELHLYRTRSLVQVDGMFLSNREHRAILKALARRDPHAAWQANYDHVMRARERMLRVTAAEESQTV